MPKTSVIPNKVPITLVINKELKEKAQRKGLNISLILDSALEKELNPDCEEAYRKAIATKLANIEAWLQKTNLERRYYDDIEAGGGRNVWLAEAKEREQQRTIGQALTDIKDSR